MAAITRIVVALVVVLSGVWPAGRSLAEPVTEVSETAAPAASMVPAIWLEHEASFVYVGRTTYYTCDGMRDKVRFILQQVGARRDGLKVSVGCVESGGRGIEPMPRVKIKAAMPTEATPELLQQLRDDPKRALVAHVRGESDATMTQFAAVSKLVQFDGSRRSTVEDGDCELLEHLVDRVFPELGVRVVDGSRLRCMWGSVPVGSVRLSLESLHEAPRPDTAPKAP